MTLILIFAAAMAQPASAAQPAVAAMPTFLIGCWEHLDGPKWTQECWTDPRGGQMMGSSRSGSGNAIREWEWLRIERDGDGALKYLASPSGRPAVPFTATTVTSTEAEFTNPSHDYPQRIRYQIKDGKIEAEISKLDGSNPNRWSYRRAGSKD